MNARATRRGFLQVSTAGVAGSLLSYWTGSEARASEFQTPAEQPVVAFIGTGIRYHTALGRGATEFGPCAAISDVDAVQAGRAVQVAVDQHREHGHPITIAVHEDYRHVLDRQDVDVVLIATPDHWHTKIAIDAMRAGKDVYCEKPLTLTIREGQQLLQVMRETQRIVQVGTQQRTEYDKMFARAAAIARDGRVGEMKRVTCAIGGSRQCEPLPVVDPPKSLNWNLWLGQAPWSEYRAGDIVDQEGWGAGFPLGRAHRYYRWWYEYSGGKLTDWGAHHVDIALWALDKLRGNMGVFTIEPVMANHPVPFADGMPTVGNQFNAATEFSVSVRFSDGIELMVRHDASDDLGFENGIMFEGSAGRFLVNRSKLVGKPVEELSENPLPSGALADLYGGTIPISHMQNFMNCVKSRSQPISDVESHNRTMVVCHAINIALRLGRTLTFDSETERFVDDEQANSFLQRQQRKGFEINV